MVEGLDPEVFDDPQVVDDADEFRLGAEYVFFHTRPVVAPRLGVWLDPDHRLRAAPDETEPFDLAFFQPADDEIHLAVGVGLVFRNLQLDIGADFSELVDTAAISAIYKF